MRIRNPFIEGEISMDIFSHEEYHEALRLGLRYVMKWPGVIDGVKIDRNTPWSDINETITLDREFPCMYEAALIRYLVGQKAFVMSRDIYELGAQHTDRHTKELIYMADKQLDYYRQAQELRVKLDEIEHTVRRSIEVAYHEGYVAGDHRPRRQYHKLWDISNAKKDVEAIKEMAREETEGESECDR